MLSIDKKTMDSLVVNVEKKRDYALERNIYELSFRACFPQSAEHIILNTSYVETVTQVFQHLIDDLYSVAETMQDMTPEQTQQEKQVLCHHPTRDDIRSALGKMKRVSNIHNLEPCTICTHGFVGGQFYRKLNCGHFFHKKCVDRWLYNCEPNCPNCRTPVVHTIPKTNNND